MPHQKLTQPFVDTLPPGLAQAEIYDALFTAPGSFGVRVGTAGRKSYFLIYNLNGRRRRMTLGHHPLINLEEARRIALRILRQVGRGQDPAAERRAFKVTDTLNGVAELFLDQHVSRHCSPATRVEYGRILKREILPLWGARPISKIRRRDIIELTNEIAYGRGKSVMANRVRATLGSLFRFAKEQDFISLNPVRGTRLPSTEHRGERVFTDSEIRAYWQATSPEREQVGAFFKLLLVTGQRERDLLRLKWSDLRLDSWELEKSGSRKFSIPLSPLALELLRTLRSPNPEAEFVFPSPARNKTTKGHLVSLQKAQKRIALTMHGSAPWNLRDLRRTVRSRLASKKVSQEIIDQMLACGAPHRSEPAQGRSLSSEIRAATLLWSKTLAEILGQLMLTQSDKKVETMFR